jgi:hypothetical protein
MHLYIFCESVTFTSQDYCNVIFKNVFCLHIAMKERIYQVISLVDKRAPAYRSSLRYSCRKNYCWSASSAEWRRRRRCIAAESRSCMRFVYLWRWAECVISGCALVSQAASTKICLSLRGLFILGASQTRSNRPHALSVSKAMLSLSLAGNQLSALSRGAQPQKNALSAPVSYF